MVAVSSASRFGLLALALIVLRHFVPFVLVMYLVWRYDAWTDPVFLVGVALWALAILARKPMIRMMTSQSANPPAG